MAEFMDRIKHAGRAFTREISRPAPAPSRVKRRRLTEGDVLEFHSAAEKRELEVWSQIDDLLSDLSSLYPVTVLKVRHNLKWLRKQAAKKGLPWGLR